MPKDPSSRIALADWLQALDSAPATELRIGVTGHMLLDEAEVENVVDSLREGALPKIFPPDFAGSVCLLTGLAPGADLLFTRVVAAWLLERGIPCRILGLLPVPVEILIEDWAENVRGAGFAPGAFERRARHEQVQQTIASCQALVDLLPLDAPALDDRRLREDQYRRLAACLAERCDLLVAILRRGRLPRPGGTAEAVQWRRDPQRIPARFSTYSGAPPRPVPHSLIVIDPGVAFSGTGVNAHGEH